MRAIEQIRTVGFVDGVPIKLVDGQEWIFPKPRLVISPIRDPETGRFVAGMRPTLNDEYGKVFQESFDASMKLADSEDDGEARFQVMSTRLELATILLRHNYALDDDDVTQLLTIDDQIPESVEAWKAIDQVVMGESQKPSPDTSE